MSTFKLSDKYITVSPEFIEYGIDTSNVSMIDSIDLREKELNYNNGPEDRWPEMGCTADIYVSDHSNEKLIYVCHQGRLFAADNIIVVAAIVEEIKASEALKLIK